MNYRTLLQALLAACLFMLLAAPLAAHAAQLSPADSHFLQAAAAADAFQLQAARLASERAASTEVRAFAEKMRSSYQERDAGLRQLARAKRITLPAKAEPGDQRALEAMAGKTGEAFDSLYIEQVALLAHEKSERLYRTAAEQSADAQVRDFALRHQPVLADQLALARALKRDPAARPDAAAPPARQGEPPPVSPAERSAPASVAPETVAPQK
ncbi:Predicted outer membrane protein [Achromobacter xylosoxidans]|uniref:DUF4142 domain-containing protein n=2 Tax=Alcaligenes xylosoxydans xylosoxydans TaxID=85698 RepID=UPI0006C3DC2A|nr:DUF4142 domain-containing protein [Achromobacter xylosoxidans]OFL41553.1 hypothetical protein HMPREF2772_19025 [Achromobacter xylosoxidans]CUI32956.1 Predicted outer membrane protein [Achromobacter xylosoxidans]